MHPVLLRVGAWFAGLTLAVGAAAQTPQPPEIAARSYLLVDLTSQRTLAEREADARADPASLTKLMTAYLVFGAIRDAKLSLTQTLPVSPRAWAERKGGGSLMFIEPKMTPTVEQLLQGMIIVSGNDAAVALAEGVGGTVENFVAAMNRQAQAWQLTNTQFRNPTGLTEAGHYSSARDLAVIAGHIIREFPTFYRYYGIREFSFNQIRQDNRNLLLGRDPTVDGMKTGYTEAAGYCLIASARRSFSNLGTPGHDGGGERRLLSVVMGTASREARAGESQKLLNWGFTAWDAVRLFDHDQAVATVPVWKGKLPQVRLGAAGALVVTVPHGDGDKLKVTIKRTDPLVAPLALGQAQGSLVVSTVNGAPVAEVPLVALEAVETAGILGRAWDSIRLWIK
jgi:D-alanyl-D-alanine carboxypeptidase (penicillin-binding protein 5/6)